MKTDIESALNEFGSAFHVSRDRFRPSGSERLLDRFRSAATATAAGKKGGQLAVESSYNELCVAKWLLSDSTIQTSELTYEPCVPGSLESIDFGVTAAGGKHMFIDVKTIQPDAIDRWGQLERLRQGGRFSQKHLLLYARGGLGGEFWHYQYSTRQRMCEHSLGLERKIRQFEQFDPTTRFVLLVCFCRFKCRPNWIEDFVRFYRSGEHGADDSLSRIETHYLKSNQISFDRTINEFRYFERDSWAVG